MNCFTCLIADFGLGKITLDNLKSIRYIYWDNSWIKHFRKLRNQKIANVKYFAPRFVKLRTGQTNTWVNRDSEPHELVSGNAEYGRPDGILYTGIIEPGNLFLKDLIILFHRYLTFASDILRKEEPSSFMTNLKTK